MSRHLEFDIRSSSTSKTLRGNWQDYSHYQKFYGQTLVNRYENTEKKRRRKTLFGVIVLLLIFGGFLFYGASITGYVSYNIGSFGGTGSSGGYDLRYTGTAQQGSGEGSSPNYDANIGWLAKTTETLNTNISSCPSTLDTANTVYTLTQSITTTSYCLNVSAHNVTVDCNGYTISGDFAGGAEGDDGIIIKGFDNATIINCTITLMDDDAIDISNSVGHEIIYSNFSTNYDLGIDLVKVNNSLISETIFFDNWNHIGAASSNYNVFFNNTFNDVCLGCGSEGIMFNTNNDNNNFTENDFSNTENYDLNFGSSTNNGNIIWRNNFYGSGANDADANIWCEPNTAEGDGNYFAPGTTVVSGSCGTLAGPWPNTAPTHDLPVVNSTLGTNLTSENLTCYPQNLADAEGNTVYPIFNWLKNGQSITVLNLPFDVENSTGAKDYSSHGNNITLEGSVTWNESGKSGGAYDLDGLTGYINVSHSSSINLSTNLTLSIWVNFGGAPDFQVLLSKGGFYIGYGIEQGFGPNAGKLFFIHEGGTGRTEATFTPELETWYHYVATFDSSAASNNANIYVNGILLASGDDTTPITTNTDDLLIGHDIQYGAYRLNGSFDNVVIYDYALTSEQIYQIFLEGNNSLNTSTIVSQETSVGENWTCEVTPNDLIVDGTLNVSSNLTVLAVPNAAPTIDAIFIPTSISPLEANEVTVVVNFTVIDTNGYADVDVSSATANFTRDGESPRYSSSCSDIGSGGDEINISCNVGMWYFDEAGDWNVTLHVKDVSGVNATNTSGSFNYQSLAAIVISPGQLTWPEIIRGSTNQLPNNNIQINHTGNAVIDVIQINATQLVGELDNSLVIYAENFSVGPTTGGEAECSATIQQESVNVTISDASLTRGNLSAGGGAGQEELYYCLVNTPDNLIKQAYSTALSRAWILKVIEAFALISIARKKRKKRDEKKKEILNFLEEMREDGKEINLDELSNLAIELKREEEISIPIELFRLDLAPAESVVKYLKENRGLKLSEIARLLSRDDRSIWTTYDNSCKKQTSKIYKESEKSKLGIGIPISVFNDRKLSMLESLVVYLRKQNMSNVAIAEMIGKDPRNTFTVYKRAQSKLSSLKKKKI